MKDYIYTSSIPFTLYKWLVINLCLRPKGDEIFKFSFDLRRKCSLPGIYINIMIFRLFNIWISIQDERIFDEKTGLFYRQEYQTSMSCFLTIEQRKEMDHLLTDLNQWIPRFGQVFLKREFLPTFILQCKKEITSILSEMENYLRDVITTKR